MQALIIYTSVSHGNTEKVARAMAQVLGAALRRPSEVTSEELAAYDLIGFGSGIYFGRHHAALLALVERLPGLNKRAFLFSTRGAPILGPCHHALKSRLWAKGWRIVGEFSCLGWDTYGCLRRIGGINKGRPNERDLARARTFAARLRGD